MESKSYYVDTKNLKVVKRPEIGIQNEKGELKMDSRMVGVIGGLSHESSDDYSAGVHRLVNQTLGGLNNAKYLQLDVNFAEIREDMLAGKWSDIGYFLGCTAKALTEIGAQYIAVASNTIHRVAPSIEEFIGPEKFIHIGDCIGQCCIAEIDENREQNPQFYDDDTKRVLLLGTQETMAGDFIEQKLRKYGLLVSTPNLDNARKLNTIIFDELCKGKIKQKSQIWYLNMIQETLNRRPVDAIILGCTELAMLYNECDLSRHIEGSGANNDLPLAVIDSKRAHIQGIAEACLGQWKAPTE